MIFSQNRMRETILYSDPPGASRLRGVAIAIESCRKIHDMTPRGPEIACGKPSQGIRLFIIVLRLSWFRGCNSIRFGFKMGHLNRSGQKKRDK